jgi:hypothetical protein
MRGSFLLPTVLLALITSGAHGDVTIGWVEVDNSAADAEFPGFSDQYITIDLQVTVTGDDDWTATDGNALAAGDVTIFQHDWENLGGRPPTQALFDLHPALEFDSYWCAATRIGPGETGLSPQFFDDATITDTEMDAGWYDIEEPGDGTYTIARYTIRVDDPVDVPWIYLKGRYTTKNTGGMYFSYWFPVPIPAPSALAVLGATGFMVRRRGS